MSYKNVDAAPVLSDFQLLRYPERRESAYKFVFVLQEIFQQRQTHIADHQAAEQIQIRWKRPICLLFVCCKERGHVREMSCSGHFGCIGDLFHKSVFCRKIAVKRKQIFLWIILISAVNISIHMNCEIWN